MSASPEVMEMDERIQEVEDDEAEEQILGEEQQEEDPEAEEADEEDEEGEEDEEDENQGEDQPVAESEKSVKAAKSAPAKQKRGKKVPVALVMVPGKSLLPFSRVQKVIKADKDIPIITRDAVFLISNVTESFIKEWVVAAHIVADKERRTTVQHKDVATVVRKADEFMFLEDIMPWTTSSAEPKRSKPTGSKAKTTEKPSGPTLDKFMKSNKEDDRTGGTDVVMNEDGTMHNTTPARDAGGMMA